MRRFLSLLVRPSLVPLWVLAIAIVVLVPDLWRPGLWEPHEIAVADAAVARNLKADQPPPPPAPAQPLFWTRFQQWKPTRCSTVAAPDDLDAPRTMPSRLAALGLDIRGSDFGMRLPFALLGLLCVVATAGIALRFGSGRAGLIAAIACLSFPIFVLDARMLDGDIGTPTAAALIVYGAAALGAPRRGRWLAIDRIVSALAITIGAWLGWRAGGALLGLLVPVGAVAIAEGFGLGLPFAVARRSAIARSIVALIAFLGACALVYLIASQIYEWTFPTPGQREMFGHSLIASDCYSRSLGGLWKVDDDLRMGVDSVFEQISFGTFPVGALAPIALFALASGAAGEERRAGGRLALAWAAASWIATQVWSRKVGFALWPGFPALAVGIGLWLDAWIDARARADEGQATDAGALAPPLVAMFVFALIVTVAVDVAVFPEKLTSLLVGADSVKYPVHARFFGVPVRACVIAVGGVFALAFGAAAWMWRPSGGSRVPWVEQGLQLVVGLMLALSLFWVYGFHDSLSRTLSSKHVFSMYRDLRKDGDKLGIMGDMGNAPRYYADGPWESIAGRDQLFTFLAQKSRVFALVPSSDLCAIHRAAAGRDYYVLDDSNAHTLLLSNQLDGAENLNPLSTTVLRTAPKHMKKTPPSPIVYDDKIELIGWDVPDEASFGSTIKVTLYFHVKASVGGSWEIFEHFDPPQGQRFQGDHFPIHNTCATSYWQQGDYIVDENEVETGGVGLGAGQYELWTGFFTGSNPNWTNMKVSAAPPGWKDNAERVHLGSIMLD